MKTKRKQEKGIVTGGDSEKAIASFLSDLQWQPSQERLSLREFHGHFLSWIKIKRVPFTVSQRGFCSVLVKSGFRVAYANIKTTNGWRFIKIVFAKQVRSL
jgi:hypothetical protein